MMMTAQHDRIGIRGTVQVLEHPSALEPMIRRLLALPRFDPSALWELDLVSWYAGKNLVMPAGLDLIADRIRANTGVSGLSHYALGTNNTPPASGQTALLAEVFRDMLTSTNVSGGQLKLTLFLGSTQGNGFDYVEGGAFNDQGTMLCRGVFPTKSKDATKTLTVIHTLPLSAL